MTKEIPLHDRTGAVIACALVDDEDAAALLRYRWWAHRGGKQIYAARTTSTRGGAKRRNIFMHRDILGVTDPAVLVDHINGAGLDNRRANLRQTNQSQNQQNRRGANTLSRTGVRGVDFRPIDGHGRRLLSPYRVRLRVQGKDILVGYFPTLEDAEAASRSARQQYMTHSAH